MHDVPDFIQIGPFSYKIILVDDVRDDFYPVYFDNKLQEISIDRNAASQKIAVSLLGAINTIILESLPEEYESLNNLSMPFTAMQAATFGASPDVFCWIMALLSHGRDDDAFEGFDEADDVVVSEDVFEASEKMEDSYNRELKEAEKKAAMNAAEQYKGPYDEALLKSPPILSFDEHQGEWIKWDAYGEVWISSQALDLVHAMGLSLTDCINKGFARVYDGRSGGKTFRFMETLAWMQDNAFQTQRLQKALELMGITEQEAIDQGLAKNRNGTVVLTGSGKALFFEAEKQEKEMIDALEDLKGKGISAEDVAELAEVLQERDRLQLKYSDVAARRKKVEGSLRVLESREKSIADELSDAEEKARYMQSDFKTLIGSDEIAGAV